MTSCLRRFGITLACLGLVSMLPSTVRAQPPAYITQWGSFGGAPGQFAYPTGVATDAAGDVHVVDYGNSRIQKFSSTGVHLTQWGSPGNGDGQFSSPFGVATDADGDVYVVELGNRRVQKFTGSGAYLTQWGSSPDSVGRLFIAPYAVATDAAGDVYVVDFGNHNIQKFTDTGGFLFEWGSLGSGPGEFDRPIGAATDAAGNVYVVEFQNHRVQKFTSTGAYLTQWGSYGSGAGQFAYPAGVATDAAGNVFVADFANHRIQKFTGTGVYLTQWGSPGSGEGQFSTPRGVATDAAGNVYVADQGNHRIQKFGDPSSPTIAMAFDFAPNTINLASRGLWVTGFLEPASPHVAGDIDVPSIRLNGVVPVDPEAPTALGDHDGNGVPDLMVKFDRSAVELAVSEGDSVPVEVTGTLGSLSFLGTDHVRVRRAVVSAPLAGSRQAAGSAIQVRWQTPNGVTVESVALLHSLDGGGTWNLIALGLPNTGSYDWTVPNGGTDQAKVAVVLVDSADETGMIVEGVLGVGGAFSIDAPTDVNDRGPIQLALRGVTPNPAQDELRVSFSLRDSKAATLALFDVNGRQLAARRVDGLGPGWHTVTLGGRDHLPAGLYVIRLTQDGRSLTTRVAVVR